jgi:hypothetical protein
LKRIAADGLFTKPSIFSGFVVGIEILAGFCHNNKIIRREP